MVASIKRPLRAFHRLFSAGKSTVAAPSRRKPFVFVREHLATGAQEVVDFDDSHHPIWAEGAWQQASRDELALKSEALIQFWDRSRTRERQWRFKLVELTGANVL